MPELPEVETIVRDLRPRLAGRTITALRVLPGNPSIVRGGTAASLDAELRGSRIETIGRRGKYLLFALDNGRTLVVHLRMTGSLLHRAAGAPADAYTRAVLSLDDGTELRFADLRKFGTLHLVGGQAEALGTLGPEPLGDDFTPRYLAARARGRTAPAKSFLLNQAIVAGVGNIYADEALFAAGIDPRRPAGEPAPPRARPSARGDPRGAGGGHPQPGRKLPQLRRCRGQRRREPDVRARVPPDGPAVRCLRDGDRAGEARRPEHALLPPLPALTGAHRRHAR